MQKHKPAAPNPLIPRRAFSPTPAFNDLPCGRNVHFSRRPEPAKVDLTLADNFVPNSYSRGCPVLKLALSLPKGRALWGFRVEILTFGT